MRHPGIVWLAGGLGCLASGAALALSLSFEAGAALALLGAGGIGAGAMARARGSAPDPESMATLDRRLDELRRLDARLTAAGVSPVERTYDELLRRRPDTPTSPATLDEQERRLGEMIRDRCDRVWEGIGDRRYVRREDGRIVDLDGGAIFAELRDIVQEVAALYHAESDNAVLEARTGDIALAVRSAVGELLQAVRQVPFVDPASWSVKTVVAQLEQAQQGLALYRKLEPWEHYLNGALLATRLATGASPVGVVAWTLGTQVAKRLGKRFIRSRAEVWLKTLLESSVALVYLRVARIYDPLRSYRGPDWIALVEALRVHACIPGVDHNRRRLLDRIVRAPIPDEFAKMALLRALAEDRAPAPPSVAPVDLDALRPQDRQAVGARLAELLSDMQGLQAPAARAAIESLQRHLPLPVDLDRAERTEAGRTADGFALLAGLARDCLDADRAQADRLVRASAFKARANGALDDEETERILARALDAAYEDGGDREGPGPAAPPPALVGDGLAEPLLTSVADMLCSAPAPWPVEHDHLVLLYASVLLPGRKQVAAAWRHYADTASRRLRERLRLSDLSTWPPHAAPAILRGLGDGEPALAVLGATTRGGRPRWLAFHRDRVVVGAVPDKELVVDDEEPEVHPLRPGFHPLAPVRLVRRRGRLTDDLVLRHGEDRLTLASAKIGNFERRFGALLDALGLDADRLGREA